MKKYIQCILIGVPLWFIVGVLITFSPEFAVALKIENPEEVSAGKAIAWCYAGIVAGDIISGLLSQLLRSRKKVMYIFFGLNLMMVFVYLNAAGVDVSTFYILCMLMGVTVGYWVIFVTIAAEQFGTNIRATVTTTVPNFVRGSLPLILLSYQYLRQVMNGNIIVASMIIAVVLSVIASVTLWRMEETFDKDLDYTEK